MFQEMDNIFDRQGLLRNNVDADELLNALDNISLPSGSECNSEIDENELKDPFESDPDDFPDEIDPPQVEAGPIENLPPVSTAPKNSVPIGITSQPSSSTNNASSTTVSSTPKTIAVPKKIQCTWKKKNISLSDEEKRFKGSLDYPPEIMDLDTPFQFFKFFYTDQLMQQIVDETVRYSIQKNPDRPLCFTLNDLSKYMGICYMTSVTHNDNIRDFWGDTIGNSLVQETMSANDFEKIRANLHFNNNENQVPKGQPGHDQLFKIRPLMDALLLASASVPMTEGLAVDEQMCATKIKHHLRQYMQNKPHKWGYKLFVLCSTAGFAYDFEIYSGQENTEENRLPDEPDLGASANVVVRLSRKIPKNVQHKLYFDNYYTSVPLMVYLYQQGILSLGTVRRNRIPNCKLKSEAEVKKLPRGTSEEVVARIDGVDVSSVIWKDNRCVHFLSTFTGKEPELTVRRYERKTKTHVQINCPEVVKFYNEHMGGVDLMDSHLGRFAITLKCRKWYFRLYYHLMDLSMINAWVLYKTIMKLKNPEANVMCQKKFRIEVIECLCRMGKSTPKRGRPSQDIQPELVKRQKRAPKLVLPPKDVRTDSFEHWPHYSEKRNRCKFPGCGGYSFISCFKCQVHLCLNKDRDCFSSFHCC